jgi:hypothetical protein
MWIQSYQLATVWVVTLMLVGTAFGAGASTTYGSTPTPTPSTNASSSDTNDPVTVDGVLDGGERDDDPETNFSIPQPDHGLDLDIFRRLWSGDVDSADTARNGPVSNVLLGAADYAFDQPPEAVEMWNSGDHQDFPSTDIDRSVYPPHAERSDALWIEDAYIEIFAVQPSTVAHVSPAETRHYIRPSGRVLGTTDYRIGLPPDVQRDYDPPAPDPGETVLLEKIVEYQLIEHEMSDITLEADGEPLASTGPTHTPRLEFTSLAESTDRLSLSVTISASFEKTTRRKYRSAVEDCDTRTIQEGNETRTVTDCDVEYDTYWSTDVDRPSRQVTVRDSIDVTVYELAPTASRTAFTDGQSALAVNRSSGDPWASYRLPGTGSVHNIWHFYSARNRHWDTLVEGTETGTTSFRSDAIPLQVHAFPSGGGAYARSDFDDLEVTQVWGPDRQAPTLPGSITLPVVEEPYSTGSVVVVRTDETVALDGNVTVHGLVRGTQTQTPVRTTRSQQPTDLKLVLLDLNRSEGTATVRLSLREQGTSQPIDLRSRPGVVVVNGEEVEPNASGTAVVTVPIAGRFVTAEYQPGLWWATDPVYESSRALVEPPTEWPDPRRLLIAAFRVVLWLSPLLFGIFLIDRLLGKGRLWPPWRDVE